MGKDQLPKNFLREVEEMGTPSSPEPVPTRRSREASQQWLVKIICFSSSWSRAQVLLKRVHCGSSGTALGFMSTPALTCRGLKVREPFGAVGYDPQPARAQWGTRRVRRLRLGCGAEGLATHQLVEYSLRANVASLCCRPVAPEVGLSS